MPLPSTLPAQVGFSAARLQGLQRRFEAESDAGQLPGGVVMIARHGRLACARAFGLRDPAASAPMGPDAIFRIFSMTKPLTTVAALILVEEGRLALTDPVAAYLPGIDRLRISVPRPPGTLLTHAYELVPMARPITIGDLMLHTSGLAYGARCANRPVREAYASLDIPLNPRAMSAAEFTARIAAAPLAHQPGTAWEYGASTDLLGVVVEAIAGKRLGAFLAERVFAPLGMRDTGFTLAAGDAARLAEPFARDPADGTARDRPNQTYDPLAPALMDSGGAGALSSAADYCRFAQMLCNGGALDGVRILSRKTVEWMTADHLAARIAAPVTPGEVAFGSPGFGFGLGVAVRLHDGMAAVPGSAGMYFWPGTAGTFFWVDPREELVVVYLTQAPGASRQHYRRLMLQLVYQAIDD